MKMLKMVNCIFFKTSLKKKEKDYTYEFWSEIIASEIGRLLGFDTLVYDVAAKKQTRSLSSGTVTRCRIMISTSSITGILISKNLQRLMKS